MNSDGGRRTTQTSTGCYNNLNPRKPRLQRWQLKNQSPFQLPPYRIAHTVRAMQSRVTKRRVKVKVNCIIVNHSLLIVVYLSLYFYLLEYLWDYSIRRDSLFLWNRGRERIWCIQWRRGYFQNTYATCATFIDFDDVLQTTRYLDVSKAEAIDC